ncbi:hypothetical protein [Pseudomonas sp. RT6P73]
MSVLSDASKAGTVFVNKEEDFEAASHQFFKTGKTVQFLSNLEVTIEAQLSDNSSGIVHLDEPGFGSKSLFLPKGSRLKLSFGSPVHNVKFQIKTTGGDDLGVAYVAAVKEGIVVAGSPIHPGDTEFVSTEYFDHLLIGGFSNNSPTVGDVHFDNFEWSTPSEPA